MKLDLRSPIAFRFCAKLKNITAELGGFSLNDFCEQDQNNMKKVCEEFIYVLQRWAKVTPKRIVESNTIGLVGNSIEADYYAGLSLKHTDAKKRGRPKKDAPNHFGAACADFIADVRKEIKGGIDDTE